MLNYRDHLLPRFTSLTLFSYSSVLAQILCIGLALSSVAARSESTFSQPDTKANPSLTAPTAIASDKPISDLITFDNFYSAKLYGFNISVNNRLTKIADQQYELVFKADSVLGTITEKSRLEWAAQSQTIIPLEYSYKRKSIGKSKVAKLSFDWQNKTVTNNVNKTLWKMEIEKNVQDKLSYQIQLQQDLTKGHKNFTYQIADGGRLKDYQFVVESEEILDTPLGKVNTVKVKRSRGENDERITYAWLAKDFGYLLVRLQQEEKGKVYTIYIQKSTVNGKVIERF